MKINARLKKMFVSIICMYNFIFIITFEIKKESVEIKNSKTIYRRKNKRNRKIP